MLDYAVTLEFDRETKARIQALIDAVADATGCDHMKKAKIPPHVTLSALVSDREAELISETENLAKAMCKGKVQFANIGVFNPLVIYLGPVMNEYLLCACKAVNERLLQFADVGNWGRYLPYRWVPHAGIAVKLTPEALKTAFAIVQENFTAFEATAERLILARAEPYEELGAWSLRD